MNNPIHLHPTPTGSYEEAANVFPREEYEAFDIEATLTLTYTVDARNEAHARERLKRSLDAGRLHDWDRTVDEYEVQ